MAISSATELKILVKTAGEQNLTRLARQLEGVGKNTASADFKFDKFSRALKRQEQQATRNISNLRAFSGAWRDLANSVDVTSREFREATREAQRFERQIAKAQGRGTGRAMGLAKGVGGVLAGGIFGGPEGLIGGALGLPFGPGGVAAGAAIGATVGSARQALGGTASYAAGLQKQRLALKLVTKDAGEYERALKFISTTSRELAIPQDILTRQFTKLSASVIGAGGDVKDAETAFIGVASGIRGTGGSLQDLDSALTATSQVFSKGKVSAEELRQQIGERLPGAFTLFASSLEMTPAELDKALEDGRVSLQDFQTFAVRLFKEFGASAKIIADSPAAAGDRLTTAMTNLSNSVGTLLQPIGAAFQTTFADIANAISKAADRLNEFFGIAGKAKMQKITEAMQREAATLYQLEERRKAIKGSPSITEKAKGIEPETLFLDRDIRQAQARFDKLQQELFGIQAINRATAFGKKDKQTTLPGYDPTTPSGKKDISAGLGAARQAAAREQNELARLTLDYEAKKLAIQESSLKPIEKATRLVELEEGYKRKIADIGERIGNQMSKMLFKDGEITQQQEKQIKNLEIEAGIFDEKAAREIQKEQFIAQLKKNNNELTQEQLERIDKAFEAINKKTSESQQLFKAIGETVMSSLSDAFMSLFDQAKSLRDVLSDTLRMTAKLFLEFGIRAGFKSIFPGMFAMGGIMSNDGAFPLKKYARGGVANSPQLAMFGEGSTPEAYVPLPDGRSIPVTMKNGGNGMGSVVVNVDATGSSVEGNNEQANRLGEAVGVAVRQELIRQKRPGGLLA